MHIAHILLLTVVHYLQTNILTFCCFRCIIITESKERSEILRTELKLHQLNVEDFIKTISNCKGDVFLETNEGDILNLKSRLLLLSALGQMIQGQITETTVRCELAEDETKLFRFGLYGEVAE